MRTQLKYVHCFEENRKMFPHNYPRVIPGKMNTKHQGMRMLSMTKWSLVLTFRTFYDHIDE